jgi:hypothetical protein
VRYRPLSYRRPRVRFHGAGRRPVAHVTSVTMVAADQLSMTVDLVVFAADIDGFSVAVNGVANVIAISLGFGGNAFDMLLTDPTPSPADIRLSYAVPPGVVTLGAAGEVALEPFMDYLVTPIP